MITEFKSMKIMKDTILAHFSDALADVSSTVTATIADKNIVIDQEDPDNMPCNDMIWITPNDGSHEELTISSDRCTFSAMVTVICKGRNHATLIERVDAIANAVYLCLKRNQSLDGNIDALTIGEFNVYPYVDAQSNSTAIDMSVTMTWQKIF